MRYRCFCMTDDDRIITGAFVEAESAIEARAAAEHLWQNVPRFHYVDVWHGALLLSAQPASSARGGRCTGDA